jgi:hypothetical protein
MCLVGVYVQNQYLVSIIVQKIIWWTKGDYHIHEWVAVLFIDLSESWTI